MARCLVEGDGTPKQVNWIDCYVANIDFRVTNKEFKELKNFSDKFEKYHHELADKVMKELLQMRYEA